MKAIRVQAPPSGTPPYSAANPASSSSLYVATDISKPEAKNPGELVVQIKATTVIRDNLTWPELYTDHPAHLGNDFSGIVVDVHKDEQTFKTGDEVYGMTNAHRGGTWAEYALVTSDEASIKPTELSWEQAAALPLSALTADQALFEKAGLKPEGDGQKRVLVTGASGGVGMFIVQFAAAAGYHVIAASSSNVRNEEFLKKVGATEVAEYQSIDSRNSTDVIIDTVGGDVLRNCWGWIKPDGHLISIDSASWNFVEEHQSAGYSTDKEHVKALFFIVEPSKVSMARISGFVASAGVKGLVSKSIPFSDAKAAYDLAHSRDSSRGKVVLTI